MQAIFAAEPSPPPRNSPPGFCVGCAYVAGCEAGGYGKPELSGLRHLVERNIGNHLGLATETVSRLLARFGDQALIRIDRQGLDLLDGEKLRDLEPSPLKH